MSSSYFCRCSTFLGLYILTCYFSRRSSLSRFIFKWFWAIISCLHLYIEIIFFASLFSCSLFLVFDFALWTCFLLIFISLLLIIIFIFILAFSTPLFFLLLMRLSGKHAHCSEPWEYVGVLLFYQGSFIELRQLFVNRKILQCGLISWQKDLLFIFTKFSFVQIKCVFIHNL